MHLLKKQQVVEVTALSICDSLQSLGILHLMKDPILCDLK